MPSGGALASAVYAITDAIPFYDIGTVKQRIAGVRSAREPTFGDATATRDPATLESEVQLDILIG